ncbi:unnamed protein product, partial [Soboliphyme baturini]|uniref:Acyl-CoA_dh_1 domain-containing protein n=1 Tax=Soboliphyme baturini TaxID=241478 RepID=A0A183JA63_9BILA
MRRLGTGSELLEALFAACVYAGKIAALGVGQCAANAVRQSMCGQPLMSSRSFYYESFRALIRKESVPGDVKDLLYHEKLSIPFRSIFWRVSLLHLKR